MDGAWRIHPGDTEARRRLASETSTQVSRACNQFLHSLRERNVSAHTIKAYSGDLELFAAYVGPRKFDQIDHVTVRGFLSSLYEKGLGKTSVARSLAAVRSLWAADPAHDHLLASGFNPTLRGADHNDWISPGRFGLDQGIVLLMIENHRSGLIWRLMRDCPPLRVGLRRAVFRGGWL